MCRNCIRCKEDYSISAEGFSHCDFSMLFEIKMIKELLEERGHVVYLLGNYQKLIKCLWMERFQKLILL